MAMCKECGDVVSSADIIDGLCLTCMTPKAVEERNEITKRNKELETNKSVLNDILVTTETMIDLPIEKRINVVFSQHVYGMNIVKDFFTGIRDIVGGRVGNIEKSIEETNKNMLEDIKSQAYSMGGDAIIGLKVDYNTTNNMLSVIAMGTVVKLK